MPLPTLPTPQTLPTSAPVTADALLALAFAPVESGLYVAALDIFGYVNFYVRLGEPGQPVTAFASYTESQAAGDGCIFSGAAPTVGELAALYEAAEKELAVNDGLASTGLAVLFTEYPEATTPW